MATIATPETILRWYRELVVANGDGVAVLEPDRNDEVAVAFRLAQ